MFQLDGIILAPLTVGNVFTSFTAFFSAHREVKKQKLFSCEGRFRPTRFCMSHASFVYGLIICGIYPEARKTLTVIINSAGRSSLLNHLSAWSF